MQVDHTQVGLVNGLAVIMAQRVGGGGAAKVNIDKVTDELSELGKQYPFQIPPFFALVLRCGQASIPWMGFNPLSWIGTSLVLPPLFTPVHVILPGPSR